MSDEPEIAGKAFDRRLVRRIVAYVRPYPRLLVGALALLPVVMVFDLLQPKIVQLAIDRAIVGRNLAELPLLALAFLGALIGQNVASYFQVWFLQLLGERTTNDLRVKLYRHVLGLRLGFFDRTPVGKLMTRVSGDVEALNDAFSAGLVTLVADLVRLAVILVILLRTDVTLTVIALASAPILFAVAHAARRVVREAFRLVRTRLGDLNGYTQEHLAGMKIVQSFGREERVRELYTGKNRAYRDANLRAIRADSTLYAVVEMVGSLAIAALLFGGASRIAHGTLTIGVLVAFLQYLERLFAPIRDLSTKYTIMQSAMAAAERIFALLDRAEPDALAHGPAAPASAPAAPHLAIESLRFSYRKDEPVLDGVSFAIERGETVALVGLSGGGKSTLVKLLLRLYEPASGHIRLGGVDTQTYDGRALRRRLLLVPQEAFLFSGTLGENLALGLEREVDLEHILAQVGADAIVKHRPQGLAARVLERGGNLSAGERQLVAFARALARDPEILILDEATANVDPETETAIERGIEVLLAGRTSLVIAHRLSTLARANRILVLHEGRIAEEGSHPHLLAAGGLYAKLYRLQMEGGAEAVS